MKKRVVAVLLSLSMCMATAAEVTAVSAADFSAEIAVTEDNDPNQSLHKQGGYNAEIFFTDTFVNQSSVYGTDVISRGTQGGGAVEVYETAEGAQARDTYLALFDGMGAFNPGSHHVYGTVVIRTSSKLTATQQQTLEQEVADALLEVK